MEGQRVQYMDESVTLIRTENGCWMPQKRKSPLDSLGIGIKVIEDLGSGTFSRVKRVHCAKLNKDFAVKIITKQKAPTEVLEKFLPREITIMKKLEHERLVGLEGALLTNKHAFLLMDYACNGDIQQFITKHGHFSEPEARRIFHQLLDVMGYLHGVDVVHRDIKCDNIYFNENFNIKLGDFGFACLCGDDELLDEACGSYVYAAPEILEGDAYNGKRADIWSMGIVLYAMLCGRLPYHDESFDILIDSIYNPQEKLRFHTRVSKDCRHFVRTMITADPRKRATLSQLKRSNWMNKPIDTSTADFTSPTQSEVSYSDLVNKGRNRHQSVSLNVEAEHGFAENHKDGKGENEQRSTVSDVLKAVALRHALLEDHSKTRRGVDPGIGHGPHRFTSDNIGIKGPAGRRIGVQLSSCQLFPNTAKGDHHHTKGRIDLTGGHAKTTPNRKASLLMLTTGHCKGAIRRGSLGVHRGALQASGSMIHMANDELMASATHLNEVKITSELSHLHFYAGAKVASLAGSKRKKSAETVRRNSVFTETLQLRQQPMGLDPKELAIVNQFRSKCEHIRQLVA